MSQFADYELKEFDASGLTGSFQNFGAALANPCFHFWIYNGSNVDVYVSLDGSNNTWRIPQDTPFFVNAYDRHNTLLEGSILIKDGTQLQIKQVTGAGTGTIIANLAVLV